jgi:hypothetical protein
MPGRFGHRFGPRRRRPIPITQAAGPVSPTTFFTNSELGIVWDLSNFANLSQTTDGLTPVTATGQAVKYVKDLSPNANHWVGTATASSWPTLQQDSEGKYYLSFDGSNDILVAATPFVLSTDGRFSACIGIFAAAPATAQAIISTGSTASAVQFVTPIETKTTGGDLCTNIRNDNSAGGTQQPTLAAMLDNTSKRIITSQYNGSASTIRMRNAPARPAGGGTGSYSSVTQGLLANNFTLTHSSLGARKRTTLDEFFSGRIYSGFVINRFITDAEVKTAEDWVADKSLAAALP